MLNFLFDQIFAGFMGRIVIVFSVVFLGIEQANLAPLTKSLFIYCVCESDCDSTF